MTLLRKLAAISLLVLTACAAPQIVDDTVGDYNILYRVYATVPEMRQACRVAGVENYDKVLACAQWNGRYCIIHMPFEQIEYATTHEVKHCVFGAFHD